TCASGQAGRGAANTAPAAVRSGRLSGVSSLAGAPAAHAVSRHPAVLRRHGRDRPAALLRAALDGTRKEGRGWGPTQRPTPIAQRLVLGRGKREESGSRAAGGVGHRQSLLDGRLAAASELPSEGRGWMAGGASTRKQRVAGRDRAGA